MRRAYLVYHPNHGGHIDSTAGVTLWVYAATVLLDTATLSFHGAGMATPVHRYDAFLRMEEGGDAALEDTLSWDDEVWSAVEIGAITPEDTFREIVKRVRALHPPTILTMLP